MISIKTFFTFVAVFTSSATLGSSTTSHVDATSPLRNLGGKGRRPHLNRKHHFKNYPKPIPRSTFYNVNLSHGENATLLDDGPLLVYADCDANGTRLVVNIEWCKDLLVSGDTSEDNNLDDAPLVNQTLLEANTVLERDMWVVSADNQGNDVNDGAVWVSTGHYVGWTGDATIGIHRTNSTELDLANKYNDTNCLVAGVLYYFFPYRY